MSDPNDPRPSAADRRAYLLGRADDDVRDRVETDLFDRPEAHDELLALEQDLSQAYAEGALTADERTAFEARLAADPRLQITHRVTRALDAHAAKAPAPDAEPRPWWTRLRWLAPVAVAAAAVFLVLPTTPGPDGRPDDRLVRKGPEVEAEVEVRCLPRCVVGAKLALDVRPPAERRHLAAFARRADGPVTWYEPAADGRSLAAPAAGGVWPDTFGLGPEDGPGPLDVYLVFSSRGLTRGEVAAAVGDDLRGGPEVTVVHRRIDVEARP